MAARIYTRYNDARKRTRKGRIRKEKLPQIWKGRQGLQPQQQSNARQEFRKKLRKRKNTLARRPITLRENSYATQTKNK